MYPKSNKIELFARQRYLGWDACGNELSDEIVDIKQPSRFFISDES